MTVTHFCTVAAPSDVAGVRLLKDALAVHQPGATLMVAALPGARKLLEEVDGLEVLTLEQLGAPEIASVPELLPTPTIAALARPLLLRRALEEGTKGALLLAADCDVRGSLDDIGQETDVLLVPRFAQRLPDDGERPDSDDLAALGEFDDEIVAVRSGTHAARFVSWWLEQVIAAVRDAAPGSPPRATLSPLRVAARSLDGVAVLDDAGFAVSAWNLQERPLTGDIELLAAGRPLRLLRFAGFRPDRPWWLSEDASRVRVLGDPVLARLCRDRASALLAAGWTAPSARDASSVALASGLRLDDRLRRLLLEASDTREDFGDLSEPAGAAALLRWLEEPAAVGGAVGVNRYTHDVWRSRDDVQRAYPDLDGDDAEGFVGWLWVHGRGEHKLDARLLPPAPAWLEEVDRRDPRVQVIGYLRGNLGLGQAARGYAAALRAGGVHVGTHTVPLDGPIDDRGVASRRLDELAYDDEQLDSDAEVVLACVNAPQLPGLIEQIGEEAFDDRYVIGQWGWETDAIPSYWGASFELVDEIWVYSTYVADVISAVSPKPVVTVPLPVEAPTLIAEHHGLELPRGDFTFLFAFDFLSTLQRKNPLGLIEAFKQAFRPGEGPRLVLKTTNARFRPELHDRLRFAVDGRSDIAIVDATLQPPQMAALFAQADCYVSLHRSEGFGLTLAESMVLGKPVIATGFSGNLDFMSTANSHLVDFAMTDVGPEGEHYPADGTWAEPSLEHAAHLMREVWREPDEARTLGARARADVMTQLSPAAVGAIARRRLQHLPGHTAAPQLEAAASHGLEGLEHRLRHDPHAGASGVRGLAKRAALRAMKPYTAHERRLDEEVAGALRRLSADVDRLRATRDRDRDRIARLERRLRGGG